MMRKNLILIFSAVFFLAACSEDTAGDAVTEEADMGREDVSMSCEGPECEDPCQELQCQDERECVIEGGVAVCGCPENTVLVDGFCVPETTCGPMTCSARGECSIVDSAPSCECRQGFAGDSCDSCDEVNGWVDDGQGGCTDEPCSLVDCGPDERCVLDGVQPSCECRAGFHLESGECVPDETCGPTTCDGHGTCSEIAEGVACQCDDGYVGDYCDSCDSNAGFHPDGMGGCTTDLCVPNPCQEANRSVCVSDGVDTACECDAGYHDEAGGCVVDENCQPDSCSSNGTCAIPGGVVVCTCDAGWAGEVCDGCDTANGYHPDGMGGCTTDPCLPNPCSTANKTTCATNGQSYTCQCDVGFHPDGMGGCTDDPCVPNVCAATNQACRDDGTGNAECYTPVCDDQNPCTEDVLVDGACQFNDRPQGTSCSTTACIVGEVCDGAGSCGSGTTLDCDDGNACTADSCDSILGCQNVDDDTAIPDDGVACTVDSCSGGFASHVVTDSICDDGQWCSGVETCAPNAVDANADGCVTSDVPRAPGGSGPCAMYVCDEANDTFDLQPFAAGTSCNDGIFCTTGDVCDASGQCRGSFTTSCEPTTCSTTHALGSLDVTSAYLDVTLTYEGQDPTVANPDYDFHIYAVEQSTGAWVRIAHYDYYSYQANVLRRTSKLPPGTYDILYSSGNSRDDTLFGPTTDPNYVAFGMVYLDRDVTFYAGQNTYAVDVDPAAVTVNLTYEGQDPLAANPDYDFHIYAVEKDTGAWVRIAHYDYYSYQANVVRETVKMMPGTYDILYSSGNSRDDLLFGPTTDASYVPFGMRYLQRDVVVSEGSTLSVDVDPAAVDVQLTYEGQDPLAANPDYDFHIYAVEKDTGAWVRIAHYDYYSYQANVLRETVKMMPGTYDILYSSGNTRSDTLFGPTTDANYVPFGMMYLQKDVVVTDGSTLSVDVDPASVDVNLTYDGQDPIAADPDYDFHIYAVEKETNAWVRIAHYDYYSYQANVLRETVKMMPGTYDILYSSGNSRDDTQFGPTTDPTYVPFGMKYLQKDVVVGEGDTISVDVDPAAVDVDVTYEGQDPLTANPDYDFHIYAVEKETDAWVRIAHYDYYSYQANVLRETVKMMPGTYDILYSSGNSRDDMLFGVTSDPGYVPFGMVYLQRGVTVSDGSTISVDVDPSALDPVLAYEGLDPLMVNPSYDFYLYAVERETNAWMRIAEYDYYSYQANVVRETVKLMPGTYDILYSSGNSRDDTLFGLASDPNFVPFGMTYLDRCVSIP